MGKQFNIRSDRAHELATDMSKRFGKPINKVVEEALEAYDAHNAAKEAEVWGPLLRAAQQAARETPADFDLDDLYDPETGLPC